MADVVLNLANEPLYPPLCVVCSGNSPNTRLTIPALDWLARSRFYRARRMAFAHPPACSSCRNDLARRRRTIWFLGIVLAIAASVAWFLFFQGLVPAKWRTWGSVGCVFGIPVCVWALCRRHAFSISQPDRKSVVYYFANAEYAEEFARLNGVEVG